LGIMLAEDPGRLDLVVGAYLSQKTTFKAKLFEAWSNFQLEIELYLCYTTVNLKAGAS
jgi:hypothetical protein